MKNLTAGLVGIYVGIGGILGSILVLSYGWAALYIIWETGLSGIFVAGWIVVVGIFSGFVRAFFWGPSLFLWANDEAAGGFLSWLAPGFFTSVGT